MIVDDDASAVRRPARKFPVVLFVLVAAAVIGVWQYWSWGPYTVTLEAEGTETKDFVVGCWYGTKGFHAVELLHRDVFIIGSGQRMKCPRHFLGPFGTGVTISIYHPTYQEQSLHTARKSVDDITVLRPMPLRKVLDEQKKQTEKRQVLAKHINTLEHLYLPEFKSSERHAMADRYVGDLQELVRLAGGIYKAHYDDRTLEYVDILFRNP